MSPKKILIKDYRGNLVSFNHISRIADTPFGIRGYLNSEEDIVILFDDRNPELRKLWMERFDQEISYANGSEATVYTIDINDHVRQLYKYQQNEENNE